MFYAQPRFKFCLFLRICLRPRFKVPPTTPVLPQQVLPPAQVHVLPPTQILPPAQVHVLPPSKVHILPPTQILPPAQVHVLPPIQILPSAQVQFQPALKPKSCKFTHQLHYRVVIQECYKFKM
ncbi:hypothetical protein DPMN_142719 [Dreissena polymorpha]|uniref:Uncharacterized protein n=1 Tax=Dreissena polymorpha TaxID=45954 RepID=A0A9D4GBT7_DREPO|nr:hypothetical protein DPMN_142719 [Dreissena polymorpha]